MSDSNKNLEIALLKNKVSYLLNLVELSGGSSSPCRHYIDAKNLCNNRAYYIDHYDDDKVRCIICSSSTCIDCIGNPCDYCHNYYNIVCKDCIFTYPNPKIDNKSNDSKQDSDCESEDVSYKRYNNGHILCIKCNTLSCNDCQFSISCTDCFKEIAINQIGCPRCYLQQNDAIMIECPKCKCTLCKTCVCPNPICNPDLYKNF